MRIITTIPMNFDLLCFLLGTACVNNKEDMVTCVCFNSVVPFIYLQNLHIGLLCNATS
jgi:hypothetical protein